MIEVRQYVDSLGRNFFERWFESLDDAVQARIVVALTRLENGNFSTAKRIGAIFEMKLDFGAGYRIYFGKLGDEVVILLAGGTKRRQQVDILRAESLWREYKDRIRKEKK